MIAEILNADGSVANTIVADAAFLNTAYPDQWKELSTALDLGGLKATQSEAVDALAAAKMAEGYPHDFGAPYGVQILQNRNGDDRTNWLAVASTASLMIGAGNGAASCGALRTEANVNVPVTATEAAAVLVSMQAYLAAFLARSWALKDEITAASDAPSVNAIDITAGWPA